MVDDPVELDRLLKEAIEEFRKSPGGFMRMVGLTTEQIQSRSTARQINHMKRFDSFVGWVYGYYVCCYAPHVGHVTAIPPMLFRTQRGPDMVPFGRDTKDSAGNVKLRFVEPLLSSYIRYKKSLEVKVEQVTFDVGVQTITEEDLNKPNVDYQPTATDDVDGSDELSLETPMVRDSSVVVDDEAASNGDERNSADVQEPEMKSVLMTGLSVQSSISEIPRAAVVYSRDGRKVVITESVNGIFVGVASTADEASLRVRVVKKQRLKFAEGYNLDASINNPFSFLPSFNLKHVDNNNTVEVTPGNLIDTWRRIKQDRNYGLYQFYIGVRKKYGGLLIINRSVVLPYLRSLVVTTFGYYDTDVRWLDLLSLVLMDKLPWFRQLVFTAIFNLQLLWDEYEEMANGVRRYKYHGPGCSPCVFCEFCLRFVRESDHSDLNLSVYLAG